MDGYLRLRTWIQDVRRRSASGFSLVELLVAVTILGAMAGITAMAFGGFDSTSSSISCRSDTVSLKHAESTFFLAHARYGTEAELVSAGLLGKDSDLHDVTVASGAYTISEVGKCIGTTTSYNIAAPTVGTTDHSGVSVAVMNSDGTAVSGAVVSWSQGSWTTMGTTGSSGQVNAALADGTYDFRVVLGGTTNTLSGVSVKQGTLVTFPTVQLTVTLASSANAPLSGGAVSVRSSGGSSFAMGTTAGSGSVTAAVLPAIYDVTMTYAGRSMTQTGMVVNSPTTVPFTTHTLTVKLLSAGGAGQLGGSVSVTPSGGAACGIGSTNASGIVTATVLDGTYSIAMTYSGSTATQSATLAGDTTVIFQPTAISLRMRSSTSSALTGQDSAIWYRTAGASSWTFAGYPDGSGNVSVSLMPSSYDFEARWFGVYEVKSAVAITAGSTVTWQALAATEFMRSSSGSGLSGQDSAIWVRPAGTASWSFSGYPNGSGQVVQQLLASSYDFEARWFGVYGVKSAVAIAVDSTVTWQGEAVTLSLLSSTGSGLSGQDSAIWVRPTGTASWFFSGYPNGSGNVAQQLLDGSYDVQFRWLGVTPVLSAQTVNSATTISVSAAALTVTARKTSDNSLVSGAATYVITGGGSFFVGYTDGSGQYVAQVLPGTMNVQCTKSPLTGTNSNVVVPSGGASSTVFVA